MKMRSSSLVLFTCAGLLLSGGAILGGSTVWSLLRISYYFWTTDLGVELGSSVLFVVGALLCLPACWLCTIVPYHVKSHSLVATLMTLVTVSMVMLSLGLSSMSGLARAVREPGALNASMLNAMARDGCDPAVRSSFSAMQAELKCCGVHSYSDWYKHRRDLPPACCGRVWNGKRGEPCTIPLHSAGCLRPALVELRNYTGALAALGSAIILVLGVTLFTVSYMVVASVVSPSDGRFKPQPMRIACLTPLTPPNAPAPTPLYAPPNANLLTPPHM